MIHPCGAPDDNGVSPSADGDKGAALDPQTFEKV